MHTIKVCVGSACHLKGSYEIIEIFKSLIKEKKLSHEIELRGAFCLGKCTEGVSIQINEGEILSATVQDAENIINELSGKC
ncbi:MAG: (2Fe-2S) ferredoxin domain-containing protein [Eubacteriaceae bacterium]|nr:(2Fe-2S) ferredoxin domain-containing protein [Eubacteriaceae bacterium]